MLHCDLRLRWKVASDPRFWAAISEPETPSFCGISVDSAQSTQKALAIAIVRFWCAKLLAVVCGFLCVGEIWVVQQHPEHARQHDVPVFIFRLYSRLDSVILSWLW